MLEKELGDLVKAERERCENSVGINRRKVAGILKDMQLVPLKKGGGITVQVLMKMGFAQTDHLQELWIEAESVEQFAGKSLGSYVTIIGNLL